MFLGSVEGHLTRYPNTPRRFSRQLIAMDFPFLSQNISSLVQGLSMCTELINTLYSLGNQKLQDFNFSLQARPTGSDCYPLPPPTTQTYNLSSFFIQQKPPRRVVIVQLFSVSPFKRTIQYTIIPVLKQLDLYDETLRDIPR